MTAAMQRKDEKRRIKDLINSNDTSHAKKGQDFIVLKTKYHYESYKENIHPHVAEI